MRLTKNMIYSLCYYIDGITGYGGAIYTNPEKTVEHAVSLAKVAIDMLDDWVNVIEWSDINGEKTDIHSLFKNKNRNEQMHAVSEVSEAMKFTSLGYIDMAEHDDLFSLINHHRIDEWATEPLREQITLIRCAYLKLMSDITQEWDAT